MRAIPIAAPGEVFELEAETRAALGQRLYGVARYESFEDSTATQDLNLYVLGLNYRYLPALVLILLGAAALKRASSSSNGTLG